jgi:ABC-type hemin transport system ATPase subunit
MLFYENALAINNINLKCRTGEVTGVFGANSAGKSTLMYTISGIILDVKKKEEMEERVLQIRCKHPAWGGRLCLPSDRRTGIAFRWIRKYHFDAADRRGCSLYCP